MKNSNSHVIKNNMYMLKIAWKISPKRVLLDFCMQAIAMTKKYFISLVFMQMIVDFITIKSITHLIYFIAFSSIFFMATDFFEKWYKNRFLPKSNCILYENVNNMLFEKSSNVEVGCFENAEFYNMYVLASNEADTRLVSIIGNISAILFSFIATFAIYLTMFQIDKVVIVFTIFPLIAMFGVLKKINRTDYEIVKEKAPYERITAYTERVVRLREYAEEARLYKVNNIILRMLKENTYKITEILEKYRVKQAGRLFVQRQFAFTFLYEGTVLYSAYMVLVNRSMTIGEFVILATAMKTGVWMLYDLTHQISEIFKNGLFAKNFIEFMNYEPKIPEDQEGISVPETFEELEIRNVSFGYKTGQEVFSDISLKIKKGEVIAIVGHNGAGKTTFTKLLTRLYDPSKGEILYNGVNIKEYNLKAYRNLFSVVSQDFKVFALSIRENILAGRKGTEKEVQAAVEAAGLRDKIDTLSNGFDSILTKEFQEDGVIFSGGEYQKLAVARAYAKGFEIAVFDEPSSALDPVSEYNLFKEMMEICQGKTLLFISHRLSSAMFADRIVVFKDGKIAEIGTHKDLFEQKGLYYDMFLSQAEKYLNEEEIYHVS